MSRRNESARFFQKVESSHFDASLVLSVLDGLAACVIFREYSPKPECDRILAKFLENPSTKSRSGDASGRYLGALHWQNDLTSYMRESSAAMPDVEATLRNGNAVNSWRTFEIALHERLVSIGAMLRRARWKDQFAASPIVRCWEGHGDFSLVPHEDAAQCSDPRQAGFEIQDVARHQICSANLCIANSGGGQLVLWNFTPNDVDRRKFGTLHTGGPYVIDAIAKGVESLTIDIRQGDLYIFNGELLHAVTATSGVRATVSTLVGYCNETDVILWT